MIKYKYQANCWGNYILYILFMTLVLYNIAGCIKYITYYTALKMFPCWDNKIFDSKGKQHIWILLVPNQFQNLWILEDTIICAAFCIFPCINVETISFAVTDVLLVTSIGRTKPVLKYQLADHWCYSGVWVERLTHWALLARSWMSPLLHVSFLSIPLFSCLLYNKSCLLQKNLFKKKLVLSISTFKNSNSSWLKLPLLKVEIKTRHSARLKVYWKQSWGVHIRLYCQRLRQSWARGRRTL